MPRAALPLAPGPELPARSSGLVLPGQREEDVVAFESAMVDFFVDAAGLLGVPKSVAAIYAIVFASSRSLSFADIESRLDVSKGSISQGLRLLREVGALKEVSGKSDRSELFEPDLELRKLIQRFVEQRLQKQLDAGSKRLAILNQVVPDEPNGRAAVLRRRLQFLSDWHDKARALLPIAKVFLKLTPE